MPDDDEEVEIIRKWSPYIVDIFMVCGNLKHGCFQFLPFAGTLLDQPDYSLKVLQFIRDRWVEYMANSMKKG